MKIRISFLNGNMDYIAEAAASAQLSKNFKLGELANNQGDKTLPMYEVNIWSVVFVKALQALRCIVNRPIIVNSGYRQPEYNEKVGGDPNSGHLKGWAADIQKISGFSDDDIAGYWRIICFNAGVIGAINLYDNYYHLEIRSDALYGESKFTIRDRRTKK